MKKQALNEKDKQMIVNYLKGGLQLGGSLALTTSLYKYLTDLKTRADKYKKDEASDDDVLYVDLPAVAKEAGATEEFADTMKSLLAPGLATTGGIAATATSYYAIRKLFQMLKKKELQQEMDLAQRSFVNSLHEENELNKAANTPGEGMSATDMLLAYPVTMSLIATLASGGLTYHALNKAFPAIKSPQRLAPKKVVLRRRQLPAGVEDSVDDSTSASNAKEAAELNEAFDSGMELLAHTLCLTKCANSDVVDIVGAVASGRCDEFSDNLLTYGLDLAMDTIKGASEVKMSDEQRALAIGRCVKNAAIAPTFRMLVAAEYNDMVPNMVKFSSEVNEEIRDSLVKIGGALGASLRRHIFANGDVMNIIKEAQTIQEPEDLDGMDLPEDQALEAIMKLLQNKLPAAQLDEENVDALESVENSDDVSDEDSISSDEEKQVNDLHPTKTNKTAPDKIDELGSDDDAIDNAMSSTIVPAKAVAAENK